MNDKKEILSEIEAGLNSGVLSEADIKSFIATPSEAFVSTPEQPENKPEKLSAVDVMFYIAGIVFFSTIMSSIVQSWNEGNSLIHIFMSAGVGIILWSIVYYLLKSPFQNDIRKGLTNALLLTGSLLIIVGGYIITNELIGGFQEVNYIPGAFALAILGAIHIVFDRFVKKDLTLLTGVLLGVLSFTALLLGFLQDSNTSVDVWSVIFIITSILLGYATRVVAKINRDRLRIQSSFDSFAAFIALTSMYVASFGDYGIIWIGVLIAAVFGIFYLSIIVQNKHLLGNGSFFLVLSVVTISFKYFSGFGVTLSLVLATIGLLGSAAIASSINRKYFKPVTNNPQL